MQSQPTTVELLEDLRKSLETGGLCRSPFTNAENVKMLF